MVTTLGLLQIRIILILLILVTLGCNNNSNEKNLTPLDVTTDLIEINQPINTQQYINPKLGLSFTFPNDWQITKPEDSPVEIVQLISPEGSIEIQFINDYPPPTIDLTSYSQALIDNLIIGNPDLIFDGPYKFAMLGPNPAIKYNFTTSNENIIGTTIISIRKLGMFSDSIIIQAQGDSISYKQSEEEINIILNSFNFSSMN